MELTPVVGGALAAAALCLLLKQYKPEYAMMLSAVCGAMVFLAVLSSLSPVLELANTLAGQTGVNTLYGKTLFKALGICYLVQLASDCCRDAGQTAIAGKIELAGKGAIVLLSLPLFESLAETALTLLNL
ncbi:MAG: SpoIIIAC/SpoIIIAD family protein [Massiliimalia sp.]|jgi:stage III sporulation protein AD